ncbi:hypothetical protein PROFUN_07598 [Planoprotostelium fungivorum]|uniref:Uncharacterized protein n=1 Tax=Planoprotostelium fungivorum TaxID=1890364 RepID=A0A2P6NK18_9EUKA|nr:hypothetical protein PROFUN_07598 [Planoprotostelium fungivorum]
MHHLTTNRKNRISWSEKLRSGSEHSREMECPVIHKVTDHDANGVAQKCPITGQSSANGQNPHEVQELNINTDEIGTVPSVKEYKKLQTFYRDGSTKKKENYDTMTETISKLDVDYNMCQDQLAALDSKPVYKMHPKAKEYRTALTTELENLVKEKKKFQAQQEEFFGLYEWSKMIVEICEWLELVLDDYASKNLDLPPQMLAKVKPVPELPKEKAEDYFRGLDEITYNLQESQDFFQASVDGRLNKYHAIEQDLIEAQIKAMQKYSQDSPRRQYIEGELFNDLEYVKSNMVENPEGNRRRQKMLKNHAEFCKVLKYYKEKLRELGLIGSYVERHYDTKAGKGFTSSIRNTGMALTETIV